MLHIFVSTLGVGIGLASIAYLILANLRVATFRSDWRPAPERPAVSILKPICGAEPRLYECLRSFCDQDYPEYQIVFGLSDPADESVAVVQRLMEEFPNRDLTLVVANRTSGSNPKVSNLINMYRAAKHQALMISDSDVLVDRNCLSATVAPLEYPKVGAVTCLYKGIPIGGWASRFAALFINDWFVPSVLVDAGMREVDFCFGPVTVVKRDALEAIGGFDSLACHLADDFMLGRLISRAGFKVHLSSYAVFTVVAEPSIRSMLEHELRWARTVRTCRPLDHAMSVVTFALPATAALLISTPSIAGLAIVAAAAALRIVLHLLVRAKLNITEPVQPWLVPLREIVCFGIWAMSLIGTGVRWRHRRLSILPGGALAVEDA